MAAEWTLSESLSCDFNDGRLDRRFAQVLNAFSSQPTASIPTALGGRNETYGAYRFLNNQKVTFDKVLASHVNATLQRVQEQKVVITVQDTTEIDVTRPQQQVQGTGPLTRSARHGGLLHELHAFTPEGTPFGTMSATIWTREDAVKTSAGKKRSKRASTALEQKERSRWVKTALKVQEFSVTMPETLFVAVSDIESDFLELTSIDLKETPNFQWIIRDSKNRALDAPGADDGAYADADAIEQIRTRPVLFEQEISVRGSIPKKPNEPRSRVKLQYPRNATLEIRADKMKLKTPGRARAKQNTHEANIVLVDEINPPERETPIHWVLITSLPIETVEQARTVIQYYTTRWMMDVFFKTLKSGCRVERRRFETWARMLPCIAVYLIVAWRSLFDCRVNQSSPDVNCEAIIEPSDWK